MWDGCVGGGRASDREGACVRASKRVAARAAPPAATPVARAPPCRVHAPPHTHTVHMHARTHAHLALANVAGQQLQVPHRLALAKALSGAVARHGRGHGGEKVRGDAKLRACVGVGGRGERVLPSPPPPRVRPPAPTPPRLPRPPIQRTSAPYTSVSSTRKARPSGAPPNLPAPAGMPALPPLMEERRLVPDERRGVARPPGEATASPSSCAASSVPPLAWERVRRRAEGSADEEGVPPSAGGGMAPRLRLGLCLGGEGPGAAASARSQARQNGCGD